VCEIIKKVWCEEDRGFEELIYTPKKIKTNLRQTQEFRQDLEIE
jgi:hypothetical protein